MDSVYEGEKKMSKMTLDEAIIHTKELSESQSVCKECREYYRQLAEWLEELKRNKDKECEISAREMFEELGYKRNEENEKITYLQKFGSGYFYFKITFDLSKKEIGINSNMDVEIEDDLLRAVIQQAKELGWLEEEQREETNLDHYKDEILECCLENLAEDLAVVKGRPKLCYRTNCNDCNFKSSLKECHKNVMDWLKKPYKKPKYKLTQFEYDLLNAHKDSGMNKCISNYRPLLELHEKGYFKDIDTSIPIQEILSSCEVVKDENS